MAFFRSAGFRPASAAGTLAVAFATAGAATFTLDGTLTQLTNDGYNYSDIEYSPDGTYLSYARTFGTDMVIQQKLNHGGPRDLYIRPAGGGDRVAISLMSSR